MLDGRTYLSMLETHSVSGYDGQRHQVMLDRRTYLSMIETHSDHMVMQPWMDLETYGMSSRVSNS